MKKIFAFLLIAIFGASALAFAAPASASEMKNVMYCQATANITNPYHKITAAVNSVIDKDGKLKQSGVNVGDIIPPINYNFGGNDHGTFAGQNWTTENQTLWQNDCNPTGNILTPILPVAPILTCANPTSTLTVPAQPDGINVTSAASDSGVFTVLFELPTNTAHNTYSFPTGFVNPITVTTIDNRPSDPMWSVTKGACNLPDTGAGQAIQWWMIPTAAGGFLLAALLFVAKPFIGRRFIA